MINRLSYTFFHAVLPLHFFRIPSKVSFSLSNPNMAA